MRTRANILMKVKVTCVREAMVTLQQLTATTNAATEEAVQQVSRETYEHTKPNSDSESLTHSEDANQPDQRHGRRARREERLHHISTEGQAHVRCHSWPAKWKEKKTFLERSWMQVDLLRRAGQGKQEAERANNLMKRNSTQRRRNAGRGPSVSSRYV